MKDQVDALQTSGIAATYLNSTLDRQEATAPLARAASRRVPDALRRAGAVDARYVFGARAELEHRAVRHR